MICSLLLLSDLQSYVVSSRGLPLLGPHRFIFFLAVALGLRDSVPRSGIEPRP